MVQTRTIRRARAGRRRNGGDRHPGGQLKQAPERGQENMSVVLTKRCERRGLDPKVEDNLRMMRDQREGYVLGRLLNDKSITEAQHYAGLKYAGIYAAWAKTAGMPRINAPAGGYGLTVAGRVGVSDEDAKAAQAAYLPAATALSYVGMLAGWWVKRVCLQDHEAQNMDALRAGLDGLVKHFG